MKQRSQMFENRAFVIPADTSMIETGTSKKQLTEIVEYQEFSSDTLNAQKDAAVAKYQLGIQHQDQHEIDEAITVYREAVSLMHSKWLSISDYTNHICALLDHFSLVQIELDPTLNEARANLGAVLFEKATGNYEDYSIENSLTERVSITRIILHCKTKNY